MIRKNETDKRFDKYEKAQAVIKQIEELPQDKQIVTSYTISLKDIFNYLADEFELNDTGVPTLEQTKKIADEYARAMYKHLEQEARVVISELVMLSDVVEL